MPVTTDPIYSATGLMTTPRPTRSVPRAPQEQPMDAHALAEAVFSRRLSADERAELDRFWRTDWSAHRLSLGDAGDRSLAATAVAFGTPVFHGSGAGYALTFHPDAEVVGAVRRGLGRPAAWRPALLTTRARVLDLVDVEALHPSAEELLAALDERLARGPVELTVPAAAHVRAHLTTRCDGVATIELVIPGASCPSAAFLEAALTCAGTGHLATTRPYVTSATTGERGPVLDRIGAIQREFGRMRPGAVMLAHRTWWRAW
ncbi:hypothetical protein GCM10023201_47170 [Actinomycetospora corticicola]|uniref:Uncharacterized protein n=1 Tax=Actinomycetospora corticicola TaxID=663602 RepID=A0A7Y9E1R9_9PSEU|nr:hypothetical protein [Actinomycetospora corticicola]NYD39573.1 hypothetical protein [Actinomycetospora corticicola]